MSEEKPEHPETVAKITAFYATLVRGQIVDNEAMGVDDKLSALSMANQVILDSHAVVMADLINDKGANHVWAIDGDELVRTVHEVSSIMMGVKS